METLLSRQLEQAWLETQVRKQKGHLSSLSSTSRSNSLFEQDASPSSSSSWDPGSEESTMSAPPMQSHSHDEESVPDHALHFISKMLMEEDLDNRTCMMVECTSTLKDFYKILGINEVPSLPCMYETEVSGRAVEQDLQGQSVTDFINVSRHDSSSDLLVYEDDGDLGAFADEGGHSWVSVQNDEEIWASGQNDEEIRVDAFARVKQPQKIPFEEEYPGLHEGEDTVNANREEQQWIDDLFDIIAPEQHVPADVVQSSGASSFEHIRYSDSLGSGHFPLQQSFDSSHTATHERGTRFKRDSISPISVLGSTYSPSFTGNSSTALRTGDGNGKHSSISGANEAVSRWSHPTNKLFTRLASDMTHTLPPSKTSLVATDSRLKRAASASVAFDVGSFNTFSSGSDGVDLEEEPVSFVQNENLNAEKCASLLIEGIGAFKKGLCTKPSPASTQENAGRRTIVITTVADLKGLLTSCAQAVASSNVRRANEILQEIRQDATPYGSGLQRLAHYFCEGLVARLSGTGERLYSVFISNSPSAAKMLKAHHLYVKECPFVRISHFFANRAIAEAAKGASRLHIIDFGILYGIQWPCLISALAKREGGPPLLRITGIEFPQPGMLPAERLEMTGKRLAEYAKTYGVPFEFCPIASRWEAIQPSAFNLKPDEVLIVNSMHRMHHLLDETVVPSNPRETVLRKICEINPKFFVHGIMNGNYNAPFFLSRFKDALASFSGFFDLLETLMNHESQERMMIEREFIGRTILNVVACEGPDRVERPETHKKWQNRTVRAGFDPIPLDRNVVEGSQAMVKGGYDKNFAVDEDGSWMLLSWKGKVYHGLSLWKPSSH